MSINDYDEELYDLIEELVAEGELEQGTPALGIARQVIDCGYHSLTAKQKWVYDNHVVPLFDDATPERAFQAALDRDRQQEWLREG